MRISDWSSDVCSSDHAEGTSSETETKGVTEMKTADRGLKHTCSECACKYYDLGRKGAVCPKCGGQPIVNALPRSGRAVKQPRRTFPVPSDRKSTRLNSSH